MRLIDYILVGFMVFSSIVLVTGLIIVSYKATNFVEQIHELNQNQ